MNFKLSTPINVLNRCTYLDMWKSLCKEWVPYKIFYFAKLYGTFKEIIWHVQLKTNISSNIYFIFDVGVKLSRHYIFNRYCYA